MLEHLSLETLSSQVLEFEGKANPTQLEHLSGASFLGRLLVLPANVRLDWKVIARYKHSSLFGLVISNEGKQFYNIDTWCQGYKNLFLRYRQRNKICYCVCPLFRLVDSILVKVYLHWQSLLRKRLLLWHRTL